MYMSIYLYIFTLIIELNMSLLLFLFKKNLKKIFQILKRKYYDKKVTHLNLLSWLVKMVLLTLFLLKLMFP